MDNASNPPEQVSPMDWYKLFRSRIEHEDSFIIQRLSWLVASQAFLFTAYAITTNGLNSAVPAKETLFLRQAMLLFRLIPLVALSMDLLIYISILAALRAIRELRQAYRARVGPDQLVPIQTSATTRSLGLTAPVVLPLVLIIVWLVLMVYGLG
jgi:hypothetical protein